MRVILIDDNAESRLRLLKLLEQKGFKAVTAFESIQEGTAAIESDPASVAFAICNYRGDSAPLLKGFQEVAANLPTLMLGGELASSSSIERLERDDEAGLLSALDRLRAEGVLDSSLAPDSDFIAVPIVSLNAAHPPPLDFYLRLGPKRYCLRFRKEDGLDAAALEAYARRPGMQNLYARKDSLDGWLISQASGLDEWLAENVSANTPHARAAAQESLELVQNVVSQLGFTPQAEELAKKTVALTLKALGSSPELSQILSQLTLQDGKYISSHSLMLAEVACALAHRLSWSSSATFLKLTMAAFIHDLSLPGNLHARTRTLAEAELLGSGQQLIVRNHPAASAEVARGLRQLPADVDTIILQHHEQPDGSGFPRGLFNHQISPLACVFIVAQDMLNFFLDYGNTGGDLLQQFLELQEPRYAQGTFRKIHDSLKSGGPAALA